MGIRLVASLLCPKMFYLVIGFQTACLVVAFALHYFFTVYFAALFLEAIQAYSIITSVIPYGGFFSRRVNFMLAWGMS